MKKYLLIAIASVASVITNAQNNNSKTFGDYPVDVTKANDAKGVVNLLKDKKEVEDITISGKVNAVCQAKGCWMTIGLENGKEMTVKFKDYAFFMPKDCANKNVIAHGKAFIKNTSVAELRHLAEDAGKTKK